MRTAHLNLFCNYRFFAAQRSRNNKHLEGPKAPDTGKRYVLCRDQSFSAKY